MVSETAAIRNVLLAAVCALIWPLTGAVFAAPIALLIWVTYR